MIRVDELYVALAGLVFKELTSICDNAIATVSLTWQTSVVN